MKYKVSKTISIAAFSIMVLITFALVPASAQEHNGSKKLEGSWNVSVTGIDCQTRVPLGTTTPSILTYSYGGTMQEVGSRIAPSRRGSGHGVWSQESARRYVSAFQFFRFNVDGTFAGRQLLRQEIEVSESGNEFTSYATGQIVDADGNVISTNCSQGLATRFE